jgi:drug/metabolite transporter (DMT)-like permease
MELSEREQAAARDRRVGLAMAGLTALLWGFLPIAMKVATVDIPVLSIVWFRFSFAGLLLALFVGVRDSERLRILRRPPFLGLCAAAALMLNYVGFLTGLESTTPSNAQILIQTAPLLLAVLGVVVFRERLSLAQVAGVVLAAAGFLVFSIDQSSAGVVDAASLSRGNTWIAVAAVAWAVYAALQKHLSSRGWAPQDLNLLLYLLPALTLWPLVDFRLLGSLSLGAWLLMAFLGANTLFAYGALGEALKRLPAYQVGVIITLNPLITLALMAVLRRFEPEWLPVDRVGPQGYGGALLAIVGILVVLRRRRPQPE